MCIRDRFSTYPVYKTVPCKTLIEILVRFLRSRKDNLPNNLDLMYVSLRLVFIPLLEIPAFPTTETTEVNEVQENKKRIMIAMLVTFAN